MTGQHTMAEQLRHALELGAAGGHECYIPLALHSKAARERVECQMEIILPLIRRLRIEAGEKVKAEAAQVQPTKTPPSECETTGQWKSRTIREAIRQLDVGQILGED